jgi:deoxyribonuclease-4
MLNKSDIMYLKWDVGSHITFEGNVYETLRNGIKKGMMTIQFFMGSPKSFLRSQIKICDIENTLNILKRFPTNIFTHAPYCFNLSGSVKQLAWNGNDIQDNKTIYMLKQLEYETNSVAKFGKGVIIHPGAFPDRKKGLLAISKSLNKINFEKNAKILLENCCAEGNKLAKDFNEIKTIINNVDKDKKKHIGVCIDTCHIFAAGIYDISRITEIDRMFKEFNSIIGLKYLNLIHLNDSKTLFGSHIDRHECLMEGYIWKKDTLLYFLNKCESLNIPMVLETESTDINKLFKL